MLTDMMEEQFLLLNIADNQFGLEYVADNSAYFIIVLHYCIQLYSYIDNAYVIQF